MQFNCIIFAESIDSILQGLIRVARDVLPDGSVTFDSEIENLEMIVTALFPLRANLRRKREPRLLAFLQWQRNGSLSVIEERDDSVRAFVFRDSSLETKRFINSGRAGC
jgi:hypothetical protein